MAVTPPSVLPASAAEPDAVAAAVGLERVDPAAAGAAWDAIVARWPSSRLGHFGRANRLLALGDAPAAVDAFRAAIAADPAFADAWNNLARALASTGEPVAALAAADRAVALGGPRADAYRETRAALGR
jgi:predicted Zn-dependent protease